MEWSEPDGSEMGMTTGATVHTANGLIVKLEARPDFKSEEGQAVEQAKRTMEQQLREAYKKKVGGTVAQRIEPEALVLPTAKELRNLFQEQAQARMDDPTNKDEIQSAYDEC